MFLSEDYHLDTLQQEVVVSIMLAGAIVGGFLSGPMAGTNLGAPPNRQRKPPRPSSIIIISGSISIRISIVVCQSY